MKAQKRQAAVPQPEPRLIGWLLLDSALVAGIVLVMWAVELWRINGGLVALAIAAVAGFVAGFVLCFVVHEWGHWAGARAGRGRLTLHPYGKALYGYATTHRLIADIDINALSRRQFLATGWGSAVGYVGTSVVALLVHFSGVLGVTGAGFATGALAFATQSFVLDLPLLHQVSRGADPVACFEHQMTAAKIKRRTIWSFFAVAVAVIAWNLA